VSTAGSIAAERVMIHHPDWVMSGHPAGGEGPHMIERLSDMPDGTMGFRAWGEVTREDYVDVLLPSLREAVERGDPIRLLFQMGPDFGKFSAGALMADTKTGLTLGLGHLSSWKRCALVTDVDWIRHTVELLGWMTPGELRLFAHEEIDGAKGWVAG
jgi:SpoIIAA-like